MYIDRLELLVTLLEEVKSNKNRATAFNLNSWCTPSIYEFYYEIESCCELDTNLSPAELLEVSNGKELPEGFCGTVACAVGHACLDKRFNELGLQLVCDSPDYNGETSWKAVSEFFGINGNQAFHLFSPADYPEKEATSIDQVIERLKTFIASNHAA